MWTEEVNRSFNFQYKSNKNNINKPLQNIFTMTKKLKLKLIAKGSILIQIINHFIQFGFHFGIWLAYFSNQMNIKNFTKENF